MLGLVYEGRTDRIRSEPIPQLIFGLIYLLILTRFVWPLQLPLSNKIVVAALALVALQFHRWSKLSSGSVFSPEFPRPVVVLFNWAFKVAIEAALTPVTYKVVGELKRVEAEDYFDRDTNFTSFSLKV